MPGEQSGDLPEGNDWPAYFEGDVTNAFAGHVVVFAGLDLNWSVEHPQECREHPTRTMSECPTSMLMQGSTEPPVGEAGRYTIRVDRGAVLFDRDDNARPRALLDRLEQGLVAAGGGQVIISSPATGVVTDGWSVGLVFGQEKEDSPMAGGAAYGVQPKFQDALRAALDEAGWV